MGRKHVFERRRDGSLSVKLYRPEVELLATTARDMMAVVEAPPEGAVRDRLYPRAYLDPTEERAQQEFDALVHGDLVDTRRAAFRAIVTDLEAAAERSGALVQLTLRPEEEMQWLTALNDARLVIGTALGVTEEDDLEFASDDPRFDFGVLYRFLTVLHFELVELLLAEMGEDGSDDAPPGAVG